MVDPPFGAQMSSAIRKRADYHHRDLRASLISATTAIIDEVGVPAFTVAEAARRTGVSSAAPFRHFADREDLLAATAAVAFAELRGSYEEAVASSEDPAEQLAAVTVAYIRFAVSSPAAFELTSGVGFDFASRPETAGARRELVDVILPVGLALVPNREDAVALIQAQYALANGMAVLAMRESRPVDAATLADYLERARRVVAALIAGWDRSGSEKIPVR